MFESLELPSIAKDVGGKCDFSAAVNESVNKNNRWRSICCYSVKSQMCRPCHSFLTNLAV